MVVVSVSFPCGYPRGTLRARAEAAKARRRRAECMVRIMANNARNDVIISSNLNEGVTWHGVSEREAGLRSWPGDIRQSWLGRERRTEEKGGSQQCLYARSQQDGMGDYNRIAPSCCPLSCCPTC